MSWYLEEYEKTGISPLRQWTEPNLASVLPHVRRAKTLPDRVLRILAPSKATSAELDELSRFGLKRI